MALAVAALVLTGLAGFALGTATASDSSEERERTAAQALTAACRTWETGAVASGARSAALAVQEAARHAVTVPAARQERAFRGGLSGPEHAFDELAEGASLAREAALVPGLSERDYRAFADLGRGLRLLRSAAVVGDHPEDEGLELPTIDGTAGPLVDDAFEWIDRRCFSG